MSWISEKLCELQNAIAAFAGTTPEEAKSATISTDLSSFKVSELRAMAKERGHKGYTNLRKAELIEMLQQN
tara:strand:- start:136 stop:348 length:213 start_codon:yes stop_codon:yes gene_type:complete